MKKTILIILGILVLVITIALFWFSPSGDHRIPYANLSHIPNGSYYEYYNCVVPREVDYAIQFHSGNIIDKSNNAVLCSPSNN